MPMMSWRRFTREFLTLNGEASLCPIFLQIREHYNGNVTLKAYTETWARILVMLLIGVPLMVYGLVKPSLCSLLIQDGYIWAPTLYHSTTSSQDSRVNSLNRLWLMEMILIVHSAIGCTRNPLTKSGTYPKRWPDGSDGTMVATSSWLISQRLVGSMCLIVDSILLPTLPMENIPPSTYITIIFTQMLTKDQDRPEGRKVLDMVSTYQLDSSHLRTNGSESVSGR